MKGWQIERVALDPQLAPTFFFQGLTYGNTNVKNLLDVFSTILMAMHGNRVLSGHLRASVPGTLYIPIHQNILQYVLVVQ